MTFENNYKSIISFINNDETIRENFNKMVAAYELNYFLSASHVMKIDGEIVELRLADYLNDKETERLFEETYDDYIYSDNTSPANCAQSAISEYLHDVLENEYDNTELEYYEGENEHEILIEYLKEAYKEKKEAK